MRLIVPAGFAVGAAACALMLRHAPAAIAADRAQPLAVVTYWHGFGAWLWVALAVTIAIAGAGYVLTLLGLDTSAALRYLMVTRRERPFMRNAAPNQLLVIAGLSALACGAALCFPVVFSSDVYAYAGYGDMALHGISPYAHARIVHGDPLLNAMVWQWGNPPPMCVYGPAFVWLAQGIVAAFSPLGTAAPLWAVRILSCFSLVLCAPLAYAAFAKFPRPARLAAAAGIALNPVAIWCAAEGHNDTLALAIMLGGFALAARSRSFTGALAVALSALVKAPGALAAVMLCATAWRDTPRLRALSFGAASGLAIVAALALPLEYGVRAHLVAHGHYLPQFSLQYVSISLTVLIVALLAAFAYLDRAYAWQYLAMAAWLAIPNPYPWYSLWLLPVAFLAWRSAPAYALVALSLLSALRYYPDATDAAFAHLPAVTIALAQIAVPLALMAARMVNVRRDLREIRTPAPDFAPHRNS